MFFIAPTLSSWLKASFFRVRLPFFQISPDTKTFLINGLRAVQGFKREKSICSSVKKTFIFQNEKYSNITAIGLL